MQRVDKNRDALGLSLRHSNKHTRIETQAAVKSHSSVSLHSSSVVLLAEAVAQ